MSERIRLVVDGKPRELTADPAMPLLYALRADLALNNPKFGCGLAQCGACTVHVDGRPTPAPAATPPAAVAGPATPAERAGLKLEALIYSDLPAQRMVFINGRRYAEGDVIDGRLRVEEIQEDGVELSDQGRRFTLRVAR